MNTHTLGSLYAILSGLTYGLLGFFGVRLLQNGLSVPNMLFWRFLASSAFMLMLLLPQINILAKEKRDFLRMLILGSTFYYLGSILYFVSSLYIGTGLSMVIFFAYPVIIVLMNRFFYGQTIAKHYKYTLFFIILGMVLMVDIGEATLDVFGIILSVISCFFYAVYIMASKKRVLPPKAASFAICLGCCLSCLITALLQGSFAVPTHASVIAYTIAMGIICTALPILLLLEAMKYISPAKASILSVLEPVFVLLIGVFALKEPITIWQIMGVCLILGGALITLNMGEAEKEL